MDFLIKHLKKWEKNLDIMFSLDIQHFSAYTLTVETTLYHLVEKGKVKQLSEDNVINQFNLLQKKAKEQGFIHYEISNFVKKEDSPNIIALTGKTSTI